jgi:hypothetical protein
MPHRRLRDVGRLHTATLESVCLRYCPYLNGHLGWLRLETEVGGYRLALPDDVRWPCPLVPPA